MLRREMDVQGVIQHRDSGQLPRLYFPASLFLWRTSAPKSEHPSVLLLPRFKEKKKTLSAPCAYAQLSHKPVEAALSGGCVKISVRERQHMKSFVSD